MAEKVYAEGHLSGPAVLSGPGRASGPTELSVPFRQFVLKVHSRCNLACTYCYIYESPDRTWRDRPAVVAPETVRAAARRIAEHAATHRLPRLRIELHGGEPLLKGPEAVIGYTDAVRAAVPAYTAVTATVQSNGTLLTPSVLDALAAARIRVGLSLDGGTAALNSRRTDHAGRPSWSAASRAARLLADRHPASYAGLLCTIDVASDPREVYESLCALRPPALDFLLPHRNWGQLAPGRYRPAPTPYGDWLVRAFDLWWVAADGRRPRIRLFTEVVALLLGGDSVAESVGLSPLAAVVVDTDGSIEQVDSLKSTYAGAPATGLDVVRNTFDEALRHPGIAARHLGVRALSGTCRSCPVVRVCGGGNYAHRYYAPESNAPADSSDHPAPGGSAFRHPSVYCADLERFIRHVAQRVAEQLPPCSVSSTGVCHK
ncbi:FxsB family cyclophane-forming radical SAM/SPASM peptide maturase [Streptomyces sp. NPDC048442]|uniref:FxsB family cyclophane-forming radical SAM/SPASM peptide maturase n=1 Tax=Streptomyces sp. NPDC048442 TaxID=3154823 RepID=UPI00343302D2